MSGFTGIRDGVHDISESARGEYNSAVALFREIDDTTDGRMVTLDNGLRRAQAHAMLSLSLEVRALRMQLSNRL